MSQAKLRIPIGELHTVTELVVELLYFYGKCVVARSLAAVGGVFFYPVARYVGEKFFICYNNSYTAFTSKIG